MNYLHVRCLFAFLLLWQTESVFSQNKKALPYLYICRSFSVGMFSELEFVAGILGTYEAHPEQYTGIKVDFHKTGLYYDRRHGENWWSYFFEPICLGDFRGSPSLTIGINFKQWNLVYDLQSVDYPRERHFEIIQKYIKVKQPILDIVEDFIQQNFTGNTIITVHYRGTDKYKEAPRVPYDKFVKKISDYIDENSLTDYTIFVASDEQPFVDFIESEFPGTVVSYDVKRSSSLRPIHDAVYKNQYHQGESAIIDCLLLSRGDVLFRTPSNLSRWASYFNPNIPVFLVEEE